MRERRTARLLLLDPANRILLMKGRMPDAPSAVGFWFTIGGGLEAGETVGQAAAREAREETGFSDVAVGPVLFRGAWVHHGAEGGPVLFKETFFAARCGGGEPSRAGWLPHEHDLIDAVRWWTLPDLARCPDPVFPVDLADRLAELIATGGSAPIHSRDAKP